MCSVSGGLDRAGLNTLLDFMGERQERICRFLNRRLKAKVPEQELPQLASVLQRAAWPAERRERGEALIGSLVQLMLKLLEIKLASQGTPLPPERIIKALGSALLTLIKLPDGQVLLLKSRFYEYEEVCAAAGGQDPALMQTAGALSDLRQIRQALGLPLLPAVLTPAALDKALGRQFKLEEAVNGLL